LASGTRYYPEKFCIISGIGGAFSPTLGAIDLDLRIGSATITHPFQICPPGLEIDFDGILGMDMLSRGAVLNFEESTLDFPGPGTRVPLITIPLEPILQCKPLPCNFEQNPDLDLPLDKTENPSGSTDAVALPPEKPEFKTGNIDTVALLPGKPDILSENTSGPLLPPVNLVYVPLNLDEPRLSTCTNQPFVPPNKIAAVEALPLEKSENKTESLSGTFSAHAAAQLTSKQTQVEIAPENPRNQPSEPSWSPEIPIEGSAERGELVPEPALEDEVANLENLPSYSVMISRTAEFKSHPPDPPDSELRAERLLEALNLDGLNTDELNSVLEILMEFHDVFHLEGDPLTCTPTTQHRIEVTSGKPIYIRQYRTPYKVQEEVARQVDELIEGGLVQPSKSPYNFPLLLVPKKPGPDGEKKYRLVVDFRRLNDVTEADAFPLPNINEILDKVGGANYWSTYDLKAGFHQIEVAPEHRHLLAFQGPGAHLEYVRMPFGLKNAPATMQRLMNSVLSGNPEGGEPMPQLKAFVFMDDIVQYASSVAEMAQNMRSMLELFRLHNLKIQPEKCQLFRQEISFLGHRVTKGKIQPCPEKIEAIGRFPRPKDPKDVKSLLGMVGYYRRFVPNFAHHQEPLTQLTRKDAPFTWTAECERSYHFFKTCLASQPILRQYDPSRPIFLSTDASAYAIGGVLSQPYSEAEIPAPLDGEKATGGLDLPVAYASRILNKAERNYSTFERELLGVLWSLEHFHQYTYLNPVVVYTDHKPLVSIPRTQLQGSDRLVRWRLRLAAYDYSIQYKPGKENVCADALSRLVEDRREELRLFYLHSGPRPRSDFIRVARMKARATETFLPETESETDDSDESEHEESDTSEVNPRVFALTRAQQKVLNAQSKPSSDEDAIEEDEEPGQVIEGASSIKPDPLYPLPEFVLDSERQRAIIAEYHDSAVGGHQGVKRTHDRIKPLFRWPRMVKTIDAYIRSCEKCQKNKNLRKTKMPMAIVTPATSPFDRVYLDIVGGKGSLPTTGNGNRYILTFQDDLSKFSEAIAIPTQDADTVARAFVSKVILRHGTPRSLLTDQGANFLSELFRAVCKLLKIKKLQTTPYHPQTNGALERSHKGLAEYLRSYVNSDQNDWDEWIDYAMFTYNSTPHTVTGFAPFELLYGRKPELPSSLTKNPEPLYNYDDFCQELRNRLQTAHAIARAKISKSKLSNKAYYDEHARPQTYNVGDWVLMKRMFRENKLSSLYEGPYKVTAVNSPVTCTIRKKRKEVKVHFNMLIPYHERGPDSE
jgi:transposase InsO family protein